jgi:hypothetical protein
MSTLQFDLTNRAVINHIKYLFILFFIIFTPFTRFICHRIECFVYNFVLICGVYFFLWNIMPNNTADHIIIFCTWNLDTSLCIATGYWLDGRDSIPSRGKIFLFSIESRQSHPTSYSMGTGEPFPGDRAAVAWSWPLSSIQYRGQVLWSYISTPPHVFMTCCFINWTGTTLHLFIYVLTILRSTNKNY